KVLLHEIVGHGWQVVSGFWDGLVAGQRRGEPVYWVNRHVNEHLDAAFEALVAAGEIYPDRSSWQRFSLCSYVDPFSPVTLRPPEAQAESVVYVRGNPDSDWRSAKYAVYRSLRGMPVLDAPTVELFGQGERLGVAKPHLLAPAKLAEEMQ